MRDLMPTQEKKGNIDIISDMFQFPVVRVILASYLGLLKGSVIAPRIIYTESVRITSAETSCWYFTTYFNFVTGNLLLGMSSFLFSSFLVRFLFNP